MVSSKRPGNLSLACALFGALVNAVSVSRVGWQAADRLHRAAADEEEQVRRDERLENEEARRAA